MKSGTCHLGSKRRKVVITGGAGFFGQTLALDLIRRTCGKYRYDVELLDVCLPESSPECLKEVHLVDVRDEVRLTELFQGAFAVFHVASYGMSGSSQLQGEKVRSINVDGTKSVVSACIVAGVERLIITSTYNVVFGGQDIDGGDERMPYFNMMHHVDEYSRSKTEAEMITLEANGTPLKHYAGMGQGNKRKFLNTCALRPAAIWGKGESRHMRRVYEYLMKGLFFFRFGSSTARMDFVHVKNLSNAHILAMERLVSSKVAGRAYFISDGEHARIHNFDFFSQLAIGLGHGEPWLWLPLRIVYGFAWMSEMLWHWFNIEPLLTRAEVLKAGVNHWFCIDRARNDLGYAPKSYSFEEVLEQFREVNSGAVSGPKEQSITRYIRSIHIPSGLVRNAILLVLVSLFVHQILFRT